MLYNDIDMDYISLLTGLRLSLYLNTSWNIFIENMKKYSKYQIRKAIHIVKCYIPRIRTNHGNPKIKYEYNISYGRGVQITIGILLYLTTTVFFSQRKDD